MLLPACSENRDKPTTMFYRHCCIITFNKNEKFILQFIRAIPVILHSRKKKVWQEGDLPRRGELSAMPPLPKIQIGLIAWKIFGRVGMLAMRINKLTEGRE